MRLVALFLLFSLSPLMAEENVTLIGHRGGLVGTGPNMKFEMKPIAWGPKWSYLGFSGTTNNINGASITTSVAKMSNRDTKLTFKSKIEAQSAKSLLADYVLSSDKDTALTMAIINLTPGKGWVGSLVALLADGSKVKKNWPIGRGGVGKQVKSLKLTGKEGLIINFTFSPAIDIASDNALRIVVAKKLEAGVEKKITIQVDFSESIDFYPTGGDAPDEDGKDDWFEWKPSHVYKKDNAIVMGNWTGEQAGTKGRISSKSEQLIYDGKPIKIWGLNNTYSSCAPDKKLADMRAQFYAENGINSVRLHKYADGTGWQGILKKGTTTEFDPAALDRMDYYIAALIKRGIFVKLSASFGSPTIATEDYDKIPYANEWGPRPKGNKRLTTGAGSIFLSEKLQDLQIEQMVNLLGHKNPYLGKTYAKETGIMLIELANEESALFYGTIKQLAKTPTLRKNIAAKYTDWLLQRYGSEAAVVKRWGRGGLGNMRGEGFGNESFADKSVTPVGNPWFWDPKNIATSQKYRAPRLYDAALFLKKLQDRYYDRYSNAIRNAGYSGELMGSNWQAGRGTSHFYNLDSDRRIGLVDRHNYFGGDASMLTVAGGGILSSGMQQVAGRPFSMSEWIHVFPNQWGVEGPAIIGAYGMGLQDWDISYMFQNRDKGTYSSALGTSQWDVVAPNVFALFPAVARHVRREDIKTTKSFIPLNVHFDSLHRGKVGFDDKTVQAYDIKSFSTDKVSARSLAVSRVAVSFTSSFKATPSFDVAKYVKDGAMESATGELRWYEGETKDSGYFTINTAATKAVVGFAKDTEKQLGEVTVKSYSKYGALYITAQGEKGTIGTDKRLIVVAVARAHNTGMKYLSGKMVNKGKGPVLMEPMHAKITINRKGSPTVYICDHDGNRTAKTIPVKNGSFIIDGNSSQAVYYEIVYK